VTPRRELTPEDRPPIASILARTGFFNLEEQEVALELVDDRLRLGEDSHYRFLVSEHQGQVVGYACWGPIPATTASVDLYWIVVDPDHQGRGVGRRLLEACEEWVAASDRNQVYVETSSRRQYLPTRSFYLACGYRIEAELDDFYAPGDGKVILLKVLSPRR